MEISLSNLLSKTPALSRIELCGNGKKRQATLSGMKQVVALRITATH
jgi:hypothetical protein